MRIRLLNLIAAVFTFGVVFAQDELPSLDQLQQYYSTVATTSEKATLDSVMAPIEAAQKIQQVKSIGGVAFGISREEARRMLVNKYGESMYNPESTVLSFKNVKYAGNDFETIHFLFQSDGYNSFLNACIFVKSAKTKREAEAINEEYRSLLSKKYDISEGVDSNGNKTFGGGISPLWDGHWYNLTNDVLTAIHTDIIEYDDSLTETFGNRYGIRMIYGPYDFVKEEF